jgi:hypothetical protein
VTKKIDSLGAAAAEIAMRAAADYITRKGLKVTDYVALTNALKRHAKAALHEAIKDAKEALDAGMGSAAEATFRLSMAKAGIDAAKEVLG